MMTIEQLVLRVDRTIRDRYAKPIPIEQVDRDEFAVALVIQGFAPGRAHRMAFEEIEDNDGALQMLARHRIATVARVEPVAGEVERVTQAIADAQHGRPRYQRDHDGDARP